MARVAEQVKFSIITAAFNAAGTIADTLRTVAAQDRTDYEHIVIDGASRDDTLEVVARYSHPRLNVVSEPDAGAYDAMNKGLRRAQGDIVVFVNADDFLARPDALSIVARAFEATNADCVGGTTAVVEQGNVRRVRRIYRSRGFRPWMLRFGHMPPHPSFYAKRQCLLDVGGFDASFRISGDFDQMVKLMLCNSLSFAKVDETLSGFREGGLSTRNLAARHSINREIGRSLASNGFASSPLSLWARYPLKALQYVNRADDYPRHLGEVGL